MRIESTLTDLGCTRLAPMGTAEVEMEEVEAHVLPWVDHIRATLDGLATVNGCAPGPAAPKEAGAEPAASASPSMKADGLSLALATAAGLAVGVGCICLLLQTCRARASGAWQRG